MGGPRANSVEIFMPCATESACRLGMAISTISAPSERRCSSPAVRASIAPWCAPWALGQGLGEGLGLGLGLGLGSGSELGLGHG